MPGRPSRPFQLTPPPQFEYEQDLHESIARTFHTLIAEPAVWAFYPAGAVPLPPQFAAKLRRMGLQRGFPDFIIWAPVGDDESGYFGTWGIEAKRNKDSKLSRTRVARWKSGAPRVLVGQEEVFPKLLAAGWVAIEIAYTVEQAVSWVERWGIPTRGRIAA